MDIYLEDSNNLSQFEKNASSYVNNSEVVGKDILNQNIEIHSFKVILVGDSSVGKTCLLNRFINNFFTSEYSCTLGVEYKLKTVYLDNKTGADLKIWDTCGEERFRAMTRSYFKDAKAALLVFDLSNEKTFKSLEKWISDIKDYAPKDVVVMIVGNKSDLDDERQVSKTEIQQFCDLNNLKCIEVSAKTGCNVVLLFETLTHTLVKNTKEEENINSNANVIYITKSKVQRGKRKTGCC